MLGKTPKSAENPGRDSAGTLYQLPRKSQFKVWTVERPKFQLSVPCTVTWRMKGVSAVVLALVVVALVSRG